MIEGIKEYVELAVKTAQEQAHHSFVDGLHIGQFVKRLQEYFDEF